jgi:hypothetical protein
MARYKVLFDSLNITDWRGAALADLVTIMPQVSVA